jgi:multimeric flavodoxin WrbA
MTNDFTRRGFLTAATTGAAVATARISSAAASAPGALERQLKIVGLSCSLRQDGATVKAVQQCLDAAQQYASRRITIELIDLAEMSIPAGPAVGLPLPPDAKDDFPSIAERLSALEVAGILVGTPIYFGNMSSLCKAFLERAVAFRRADFALSNKVGGVLAVGGTRNGGQELTIRSVQTALMSQDMIVVGEAKPHCHGGSAVWNSGDGFLNDEINRTTIASLGRRMAEVALLLAGKQLT